MQTMNQTVIIEQNNIIELKKFKFLLLSTDGGISKQLLGTDSIFLKFGKNLIFYHHFSITKPGYWKLESDEQPEIL